MARLEAGSVDAFRRLARELLAHGAPRRLVRAARRAARDEIRHARIAGALARRHGGFTVDARVASLPTRTPEAIAVENAVEGCVREAFGALLAHCQATQTRDPAIRAAMIMVARDETRHAALSFRVDAWLKARLDRSARTRVDSARRRAIDELASGGEHYPATLRVLLGLPSRAQHRLLVEQFAGLAA